MDVSAVNHAASTPWRTSPDQETTAWPRGVPYIIGNEGCERFSYYGMRSILYVYMADHLYRQHAEYASRAADLATAHYHFFSAGVYVTPMIGAIVADRFLGKYWTILLLSLVYCAGHAVLALTEGSLAGLWSGLALIAVGSGGIKPCVSAHVGDQFGKGNWFRLRAIYQAFYFIINFGSMISMLVIPWVFDWQKTRTDFLGTHAVSIAFGIPGVLMFIATVFFFMGRHVFVHVPPAPGGKKGLLDSLASLSLFLAVGHLVFTWDKPWWVIVLATLGFLFTGLGVFSMRQRIEADDGFLAVMLFSLRHALFGARVRLPKPELRPIVAEDGPSLPANDDLARSRFFKPALAKFGPDAVRGTHAVLKIMSIFILVSIFWALFDQSGSSWVRQAELMRTVRVFGLEMQPAQLQSLNSAFVLLLIPIMNYWVYPGLEKLGFRMTALRRMTSGMLIAALSFVAVALIQISIERNGPGQVNILWQAVPYFIITLAEVLVSITGLEFAYTQAPPRMKSTIMGFWMFTVAVGNVFVALLAEFGKLPLEQFFWLFAGLMLLFGLIFGARAHFYVEREFVQVSSRT